ncbi:MAG: hypothetical protein AB7J40_03515 [Candidatus Altimarinota bacterium]
MADADLRQLQRMAQAEGNVESQAAFLRQKIREGADDAQLAELLRSIRSNVDEIMELTGLSESRRLLVKARMLIEPQIDFALSYAIQPREGDAPLPSREAILASVMTILTPERAREILRFHEAKLVLTPITSLERYLEELNQTSQTMERCRVPYVSEFAQNQLNAQATQAQVEANKIKSWKFAISEGAQTFDIPEWDNGRETHQQRIERFNGRFAKSNILRLDYQSYIALMVQDLLKGRPIDCKYRNDSTSINAQTDTWQYTLMNETDEKQGLVGTAFWDGSFRYVNLFSDHLDNRDGVARFRPAVMGEILGFDFCPFFNFFLSSGVAEEYFLRCGE